MNFQDQVKKTIKEEHLFASSDLLLLALSGGADSVAMLCVLLELGYKIEAVHCNFHLRGKEAMRDEQFVRQLCAGREVKLHVRHFDTRAYATMHHVSIEMAARSLRYAYFEELRVEREARYIVVGHHRDDNVETLLLNLIRGTGLHGLCGIRSVYGHLVRPLLNVCRKEILDYLKEEGQLYITDSTNLETNFTRNRIRLQLLPLMRGINPSVDVTLQQTIERLRDVSLLYDEAIVEGSKRITLPPHHMELCISIPALLKERAPKALMYEILYPYGFSPVLLSQLVEGLLSSVSGAVYETSEWTLLHNRDELLLRKKESSEKMLFFPKKVPFEGFLSVNDTYSLLVKRMKREDLKEIPTTRTIACIDADKLDGELTLRSVEKGDRFVPLGMTGHKLLSDYFIDCKFSLFEKEKQVVICCGDRIVWLVGARLDNRFCIDKERTKNIVWVEQVFVS